MHSKFLPRLAHTDAISTEAPEMQVAPSQLTRILVQVTFQGKMDSTAGQ